MGRLRRELVTEELEVTALVLLLGLLVLMRDDLKRCKLYPAAVLDFMVVTETA